MSVAEIHKTALRLGTFTEEDVLNELSDKASILHVLAILVQSKCCKYTGKGSYPNPTEYTILSDEEREKLCPDCILQDRRCTIKPERQSLTKQ